MSELFIEKNKGKKNVLLIFPSFPCENAVLSYAHDSPRYIEVSEWPNKIYSPERHGHILYPSSYFIVFQYSHYLEVYLRNDQTFSPPDSSQAQ